MPSALQLLWLLPALPLAGFLANGVLALRRPRAKHAVSIIGVGVLLAALALAIVIVLAFLREGTQGPLVFPYWEWMPVGELHVTVALQLDQLSAVMLLVVTGVSSLIHVFSVGYMGEDPGYARYFAYLNLFVFFMLVLVRGAGVPSPPSRCCSSSGARASPRRFHCTPGFPTRCGARRPSRP